MIDLKKDFKSNTLEEWIDQLKKDLKGDDFSKLERNDQFEEIEYPTFHHFDSNSIQEEIPGIFPFTRGLKTKSNAWKNAFLIHVIDERQANAKALDVLMKGCDLLIFDLSEYSTNHWSVLFEGIGLEYIQTYFITRSEEQYSQLIEQYRSKYPSNIRFCVDFQDQHVKIEQIKSFVSLQKVKQIPFAYVNGYALQQTGANSSQQIAFSIATGHEYLVRLMENGLSIDEAAACIHFSVGIGSNYFFEIAKIRALKQTWAQIIKQYKPQHTCSYNCSILAITGFTNKSLEDPYTNLLRQTTEAMSSIIGGIDALLVQPYDRCSDQKENVFTERMALNISLILQEESYFQYVVDPMGGSYAIEDLTQKIAHKAWSLFQNIEKNGGAFNQNALNDFCAQVQEKAAMRLESIETNGTTLIGVNKFKNPTPEKLNYTDPSYYLGMKQLIFERDIKKS